MWHAKRLHQPEDLIISHVLLFGSPLSEAKEKTLLQDCSYELMNSEARLFFCYSRRFSFFGRSNVGLDQKGDTITIPAGCRQDAGRYWTAPAMEMMKPVASLLSVTSTHSGQSSRPTGHILPETLSSPSAVQGDHGPPIP